MHFFQMSIFLESLFGMDCEWVYIGEGGVSGVEQIT